MSGLTTESGDPTFDPVPASSTATSTQSLVATCSGNQIEGSCTQAHLPSATADSGIHGPVCNKAGYGTYVMFNATQASNSAATSCSDLISNKVVLSASDSPPKPGYVADAGQGGGYVAITVLFDVDSCNPGTSSADQRLDFSTWSQEQCYQYIYASIAAECKFYSHHYNFLLEAR